MKLTAILTALSMILIAAVGCAASKDMPSIDYEAASDIVRSTDNISGESTETVPENVIIKHGAESGSSSNEKDESNTDTVPDAAGTVDAESKPAATAVSSDTTDVPTMTEAPVETPAFETTRTSEAAKAPGTTAAHEASEPHSTHTWLDATCDKPKTCAVCGETVGKALGHTWEDENSIHSYDDNKITCTVCGIAKCAVAGHAIIVPDCTTPGYCVFCGIVFQKELGHEYVRGSCTRCSHMDWTNEELRSDIEDRIAYYINMFRKEEGVDEASKLPKMTALAEYRARQLTTNFAHDPGDILEALIHFEYGTYVDGASYGLDESASYWYNYTTEAIGKNNIGCCKSVDEAARLIAAQFRESEDHWAYVGDSDYMFMGIGVSCRPDWLGMVYVCIIVGETDIYENGPIYDTVPPPANGADAP